MDSVSLFLTSNNYESSSDDYVLKFNSPTDLNNYEMSLIQSNVYKQWYNISASLQNNAIRIIVPASINSGGTVTAAFSEIWTISDGFYRTKDLDKAFKSWCDEVPTTRKTNTGAYPFSLDKSVNGLTVMNIYGSNFKTNGTDTDTYFCTINFGSNKVADFLGLDYVAGRNYGSGSKNRASTSTSYTGTSASQQDPISSIIFTCNLTYNAIVNIPRGIIGVSYIADTSLGASCVSGNAKLTWIPVVNSNYTEIRISTYSQNGDKLSYIDTNSVFQIALRKK